MDSMIVVDSEDKKILTRVKVPDDKNEPPIPARREQEEKRLVQLLDMRLLPTIILIFLMNYTDVSSQQMKKGISNTYEAKCSDSC